MSQQYFVRSGKKYLPVNPTDGWNGFPSEGVWLVKRDLYSSSASCILKIGELPSLYPFAQMAMERDKLATHISNTMDKLIKERGGYCSMDLADEILKFLAMNAPGKHAAVLEGPI